uniref:Uncharacterized protein n=1 Tax=Trypanosoma congolense (strain IL3000) TaxID=1068625 RepID=G0UX19_TRYCI|nr:conserved hypothetical protein [Trypanosoma congolense IL3000]
MTINWALQPLSCFALSTFFYYCCCCCYSSTFNYFFLPAHNYKVGEMEVPRSNEALKKLCDFLLQEDHDEASDSLAGLFSAVPHKIFRRVDVEVLFLRSPVAHRVPLYFILPHEVHQGSICIVTPPPQRKYKDKVLRLSEDGDAVFQRVKKVIDTEKLNAKFTDPVAVRALSKSFVNFVVYGARKYPPQLTGEFLGHQKHPLWVAKRGAFSKGIHNAMRMTVVPRRGCANVTCPIGHAGLSVEQLNGNLRSFIKHLTTHSQAVTPGDILLLRVAGTDCKGRRAGLPIFCHTFKIPRRLPERENGERKVKKVRSE